MLLRNSFGPVKTVCPYQAPFRVTLLPCGTHAGTQFRTCRFPASGSSRASLPSFCLGCPSSATGHGRQNSRWA